MSPKAPPSRIRQGVPKLLADLIENFLPYFVSYAQRVSEKDTIFEFIKDLNKVRLIYKTLTEFYNETHHFSFKSNTLAVDSGIVLFYIMYLVYKTCIQL